MKLKTGELLLHFPSGKIGVTATLIGPLGVHPWAGGYRISHRATGHSVVENVETEEQALRIARRLLKLENWNFRTLGGFERRREKLKAVLDRVLRESSKSEPSPLRAPT